jgi:hypothetical protein
MIAESFGIIMDYLSSPRFMVSTTETSKPWEYTLASAVFIAKISEGVTMINQSLLIQRNIVLYMFVINSDG